MNEETRTRVSFYLLADPDPAARLRFACRLTEKVYKLNQSIHAHVADAAGARALDELLWTFRQGSFVPHEIVAEGRAPAAPITIGSGDGQPPAAELLINLADEVPAGFARYGRIAEIIDGSPEGRESGRQRHRYYRQQGLEPETHEVS